MRPNCHRAARIVRILCAAGLLAVGGSHTAAQQPLKKLLMLEFELIDEQKDVVPFPEKEARLLAYLAPWYTKAELPPRDDPRRETFNLGQIRSGWGAFFPIYPSLPRDADMNMAIEAARTAWETPLGARAEFGEDVMPGYEYRMCIKLGGQPKEPDAKALTDAAFRRLCVDLRDMRMRGRFDWADVPEWARLWIWQEDREEAVERLGVVGA